MNNSPNSKYLPLIALGAGAAGFCLRRGLYAVAVDAKNLLTPLHPLEIALWVLTAAVTVLLCLSAGKLEGSEAYEDNFGPSAAAAAGSGAMAAGILWTVLTTEGSFPGLLSRLWWLAGLLSVPALGVAAFFRLKGKQPPFLCHFAVCVFCVLQLVSRYQSWSGNPQLQDYFFCLGGGVLLVLFAFYQTAFDADVGKRRMQLATGLLGTVFCFTALASSQTPMLYLAGGIWMLTGLCSPAAAPLPKPEDDHGDS